MQLPLVAPAPVVLAHAEVLRDLFAKRCQFRHFQAYLTGLMVLENKSLSNMARCVVDSADKTNLSRFLAEAPWDAAAVNDRRIRYLLAETTRQRRPAMDSALVLDDTLCEHVGGLFAHLDRHYNLGYGTLVGWRYTTGDRRSAMVRYDAGNKWGFILRSCIGPR